MGHKHETDETKNYVGVDIGGTFTRLAIVDAFGRVMADLCGETPIGNDGEDIVQWLEDAYRFCRQQTDSFPAPEAMGVGLPGVLEPGRSAIIHAVNLPFLVGLPLRDRLVERTGLITILDCDSVAGAWGEFCAYEKRPKRFVYLTLGTGVGGAVILDGQPLRHTHHSAGHLGHLICDTADDAPLCNTGVRGTLESLVAAPAIRHAAAAMEIGDDLGEIEVRFQNGDTSAARLIQQLARPLCAALVQITHVYAPDTIIIGGGVARGIPSIVHTASRLYEQVPSSLKPENVRVELNALGDYSGLVGAALLAREASQRSPLP